jgi:hypothetical protein
MSTAATGQKIMAIAPTLAVIPVVGWIAAAAGTIVGLGLSLFGSKYNESTGVRWLVQKFEKYVLGANVSSDNGVNEADTANAQKWFSYVLGVPVYDQYRLHTLRGTDPTDGHYLNQTYLQRAQNYMKYPEAQAANVSIEQATEAAKIADRLNESQPAGSWAGFTAAPSVISNGQSENLQTKYIFFASVIVVLILILMIKFKK